jgi:hypothetical protein
MPCRYCGERTELSSDWLCEVCTRIKRRMQKEDRQAEQEEHARKDHEGEVGADSLGQR